MSYCNKHERITPLAPIDGEKKVLQALVAAELKTRSGSVDEHLRGLKNSLAAGKKHSSSTLLRMKLKGNIVRELHEI